MLIRPFTEIVSRTTRHLPLQAILIIPFILQIFSAVGLVGYFSFRNGQITVRELSSQLRHELTARIEERLHSYTNAPHAINRLNADAVSQGKIFDPQGGATQFLQQMRVSSFINGIYCGNEQTGDFVGVSRVDKGSGFQLMISNESTDNVMHLYSLDVRGNPTHFLRTVRPYNPRIRPWYQKAQATSQAAWSDIYLDFTTQLPTITASYPVYSNTMENRLVGVCGTDVLLSEELRQFLQSLAIGKSGEAFVIDRAGTLISSSTEDTLATGFGKTAQNIKALQSQNTLVQGTAQYLDQHFSSLEEIQDSQQLDFKLAGQQQFVQVLPFGDQHGLDWLIVLVVPEADFMEQIHENTRTTVVLCIAALISAIILGILTSRWVIQPILQLKIAARAIAQGNWDQPVILNRADDLGELAYCFNTMARQLKESFSTLEHRVEQRTSELLKTNTQLKREIQDRHRTEVALRISKQQSENLLLNILPFSIAEQLKQAPGVIAEQFEEASILFADIVDFTPLATQLKPIELVKQLNEIFSAFDQLADEYNLEKIKTIGDAYMVVGGLPIPQETHLEAIADMALEMQAAILHFYKHTGQPFQIRIGINTGPVVAGVIGMKKFTYDLWGDTVNIASRMESQGEPGKIQVTQAVYERLKDQYLLTLRGEIEVKGRGKMQTYWLVGKQHC
ncbi:MAG: adenylate/guanylate cyclase domain-containing protein [Microcoleaceae cyanobacterium]